MKPGEKFVQEGEKLVARESDGTCTRCIGGYAHRSSGLGCMALPACNAHDNPDGVDIHFEKDEEP